MMKIACLDESAPPMSRTESIAESAEPPLAAAKEMRPALSPSLKAAWVYGACLVGVFSPVLVRLAFYAAGTDLHSHVLLIPFVSVYLLFIKREQLPREYNSSPGGAAAAIAMGALAIGAATSFGRSLSTNDYLALMAFSFVSFLWAGSLAFLGRQWLRAAVFPMAFLLFMVPLPDGVVGLLEKASMMASAETASVFFNLTATPNIRDGLVFQLPSIVIQVAQECSGIRSSWVLFITSVLASHLFLQSTWRRIALVAFIIPLGILRNGFRILVIGLLCIEIGPQMIDSAFHHKGGPLFFVLSLIPLFLMLWVLRSGEGNRGPGAGIRGRLGGRAVSGRNG